LESACRSAHPPGIVLLVLISLFPTQAIFQPKLFSNPSYFPTQAMFGYSKKYQKRNIMALERI
jgi:hypothetical protein